MGIKGALISLYGKVYRYLPLFSRRMLRAAFAKAFYEQPKGDVTGPVVETYRALGIVKPGDLVFDVGANIGTYSEAFLKMGAKVAAIEPQESCISAIRNRIGPNPNLFLECVGVGGKEGVLDLFVSGSGGSVASTFSERHKKMEQSQYQTDYIGKSRVKVTTLDKLIEKYGAPAYIKIDVEGFEEQVLSGLNSAKGISYISYEFHFHSIDMAQKCASMLEEKGLEKFNFIDPQTGKFAFGGWVDKDTMFGRISQIGGERKLVASDIFAASG